MMKTTVASGGKLPVPSWSPDVTLFVMARCGHHDELTPLGLTVWMPFFFFYWTCLLSFAEDCLSSQNGLEI